MDKNLDNPFIEHLKGLRSEVQTLRAEMHSEFRDVKHRLVSVETATIAPEHESANTQGGRKH